MSLEIAVQNLTAEIIALRQIIQAGGVGNAQSAPAATVPAAASVFTPPATAAQFQPPAAAVFTPPAQQVQQAQQAQQAQYQPLAAVAAPAPGACPIVDQKTLVEYVMDAYKTLGPQKGAAIQGVLNNCQVQSINECRPEHYAYIHQCVEQLKAS